MNIREALRQQAPSLALQRAAGDEIARLDNLTNVLDAQLGRAWSASTYAVSVFRGVLGDIADWEDKALAEAVESAIVRLEARA